MPITPPHNQALEHTPGAPEAPTRARPTVLGLARAIAGMEQQAAPSAGTVHLPKNEAQQEMLKVLLALFVVGILLFFPGLRSIATGTYDGLMFNGRHLVLTGGSARWMGLCLFSMGMWLLSILLPLRTGLIWATLWFAVAALAIVNV